MGLIRPIQGWDKKGLVNFKPSLDDHLDALLQERTARWGDSTIHFLIFCELGGKVWKSDFINRASMLHWEGRRNYHEHDRDVDTGTGLLLDLDNGTLTVYKGGLRIGVLTGGLSGVYSWMVWTNRQIEFSIERGPVPN